MEKPYCLCGKPISAEPCEDVRGCRGLRALGGIDPETHLAMTEAAKRRATRECPLTVIEETAEWNPETAEQMRDALARMKKVPGSIVVAGPSPMVERFQP